MVSKSSGVAAYFKVKEEGELPKSGLSLNCRIYLMNSDLTTLRKVQVIA